MPLEDIKSKIVGDAKTEADKILKEAEGQASKILQDAENKVKKMIQNTEKEVKDIKEREIERRKIVGQLEVKKRMLAAKRELIERVFSEIRSGLEELSVDDYLSFMERLMKKAVEFPDGRVVVGKDEKYIDQSFIDGLNKKYGWKLKFDGVDDSFSRGLILNYGDIDINLSFDAIFRDIKKGWEKKVVESLFGEG